MVDRSRLLEALQELAQFELAIDERGLDFLSSRDIAGLSLGEILEQIAFLRTWAGAVQILSLLESRPSSKRLDNSIFRMRLEALEEELRYRRRARSAA